MKVKFSRQIFQIYSYIGLYKNPSEGNRVFQCEQSDRQTDIMKLIVTARSVANAPDENDSNTRILYSNQC